MNPTPSAVIDILLDSIRETFETLTFSETSEWEISDMFISPEEEVIGSLIDLSSPYRGGFAILLSRKQCRELFEIAYGPEVLDSAENDSGILQDYINEIANTIAGRFATSLSPESTDPVIGLPRPFVKEQPDLPGKTAAFLRFRIENEPAWCLLTKDGEEKA